MKNNNYVMSLYIGDTYLDVFGTVEEDDSSVGYIGGIDIEDVRIANTETSVLEMIHSLGWDKFNDRVQAEYTPES